MNKYINLVGISFNFIIDNFEEFGFEYYLYRIGFIYDYLNI